MADEETITIKSKDIREWIDLWRDKMQPASVTSLLKILGADPDKGKAANG